MMEILDSIWDALQYGLFMAAFMLGAFINWLSVTITGKALYEWFIPSMRNKR